MIAISSTLTRSWRSRSLTALIAAAPISIPQQMWSLASVILPLPRGSPRAETEKKPRNGAAWPTPDPSPLHPHPHPKPAHLYPRTAHWRRPPIMNRRPGRRRRS